jgi:hypothetical protein
MNLLLVPRPAWQLFAASLLVGLFLSGCAGSGRWSDPSGGRERREAALRDGGVAVEGARGDLLSPTLTSVNNRIYSYERKLEEWKKVEKKMAGGASLAPDKAGRMEECQLQLQDILNGYHTLRNRLLQAGRVDPGLLPAGDLLLQLNQQDVDYLEGGCGRLLAELEAAPAAPPVRPAGPDPQIKAAYDNGEYNQVLSLYGQLPQTASQPTDPATDLLYAQALVKNHQEPAALGVFTGLLDRVRQPGQESMAFQVMQAVGDLSFGQGAYDQARRQYEEIVRLSAEQGRREEWAVQQLAALQPGGVAPEEMREYSALLKNYLAFVPRRDGYAVVEQAAAFLRAFPGSRLSANAAFMQKSAREQADSWLNRGIQRVEAMAGGQVEADGQAASTGTEPGTAGTPPVPTGTQIAPTDGQMAAPAVDAGPSDEELQARYDQGVAALTAREYDKAIETFNGLLATPFADRARTRIDEAAGLAAQEDRRKAADLFVRANSTADLENKKNLLLSSRKLLQDILVKYPQSGLAEKVQRNLSGVERALKAIDPSL